MGFCNGLRYAQLNLGLYFAVTFELSEGYEDIEGPSLDGMETPLLDDSEDIPGHDDKTSTVTIPELLASRHLRKPLIIISFAMLSQQFSGKFHTFQFRRIRLL